MLLKLELSENNEILWSAEDKAKVKSFLKSRKVRYIEFELRNARSLASHQQFGYLFAGVLPVISRHTGYSIDQLKPIFYNKFSTYFITVDGKEIKTLKTLSEMNKEEMSKFTNDIILFAETDLELEILTPEKFNANFKPYDN